MRTYIFESGSPAKPKPDIQFSPKWNDSKALRLIAIIFFYAFLLWTPLGNFHPSLDGINLGFYTITRIDSADGMGYYSYLRSGMLDGNIDFFDEKNYFWNAKITSTGFAHNNWAVGSALLWFPFFSIAHVIALSLSRLGFPVQPDGYSEPYMLLTGLGSSLYVLAGLLILYRVVRRYFQPRESLLATITVFLATPLPYYTFIEQRLSHSGEFFLVVALIWVWLAWREQGKTRPLSFLLGVLAGLVFDIRYNSMIILAVVLPDIASDIWVGWKKKEGIRGIWRSVSYFETLIPAFLLMIFPQVLAWLIIFGKPFPPIEHFGAFSQNYSDPTLFLKMFSSLFLRHDWGLLYSQPLWLLALPGLILFWRRNRTIGRAFGIAFLLSLQVTLAYNSVFPNQFSFGFRLLLICNVFLTFGLAQFLTLFEERTAWIAAMACFFFMLANYLLLAQYKIVLEFDNPEYSVIGLKNIPLVFMRASWLLLRSSNFFNALICGTGLFTSWPGWIMMVIFPAGAGVACFLVKKTVGEINASWLEKSFSLRWTSWGFVILALLNLGCLKFYKPKLPLEKIARCIQGIQLSLARGIHEWAQIDLENAIDAGASDDVVSTAQMRILTSHVAAMSGIQFSMEIALIPGRGSPRFIFIRQPQLLNIYFLAGYYPNYWGLSLENAQLGLFWRWVRNFHFKIPWLGIGNLSFNSG